jgi:hypothetical protein
MENTSTTPIDFRALCAELLNALEIQLDELRFNNRLCIRARAALAEPVGEGPSEEDIVVYWNEVCEGEGDYGVLMLARYARRTN